MEGVIAFNCLLMMGLSAGVMPSTFGFFWSLRRCELRLIVSHAEVVVAEGAAGRAATAAFSSTPSFETSIQSHESPSMAQRFVFPCSEGKQMLTGIELFSKDGSRIFLAAAILGDYLWTQRDRVCHHAWCPDTFPMDTSALSTTMSSPCPSVRDIAPL